MKISAVLITYNEEANIEAALRSLDGVVSEIVVVDSCSMDATCKIARGYTSRVYQRKWTNYSDQKNFANGLAEHPWILSLDADERLSPELREEIIALASGEPTCAGFSMPRRVFYLGRWIKHSGWYPDWKVRLFRKGRARWVGDYVHEDLAVDGDVRRLEGDILHFTYRNIADHLSRINTFSDLGAQKLYAQRKKCGIRHLLFIPVGRFIKSYILRAGFLDGFAGLVIACLNGYGIFVRYAKLREIWKKGERIEPFPD
ncbi:MAG: glycosyltransferase family 2 protein [Candidatus Aminicenantes bacterium]|nr:glycosyltransferase family 2 protein [Candidatus Aminicenantes bacterium]